MWQSMKMDAKIIIVIAVVAVAAIAGGAFLSGAVKFGSPSVTYGNVTGRYSGIMAGQLGNGEWSMILAQKSDGSYVALLNVTSPYACSGGRYSASVNNNQVTINWTANNAIIQCSLNGDNFSGNWNSTTGTDNGLWRGTRAGSLASVDIPDLSDS